MIQDMILEVKRIKFLHGALECSDYGRESWTHLDEVTVVGIAKSLLDMYIEGESYGAECYAGVWGPEEQATHRRFKRQLQDFIEKYSQYLPA